MSGSLACYVSKQFHYRAHSPVPLAGGVSDSVRRSFAGGRGRVTLPLTRPTMMAAPLHQEHALAGGLGVEQAIGLFRLVELPLMREQAVDIDLVLDAEARAIGLALP